MTNHEKVAMDPEDLPLVLSGAKPIAKGVEHLIYDHPTRTDCILKVTVDERQPRGLVDRITLPFQRASRARSLRREVRYWSDLMSRIDTLPPIPRYFGRVETDIGHAHLVERITLPNRPLGPTLRQIFDRGNLGPRRVELLNRCVAEIRKFEIPARDLVPRNLVLGNRGRGPEFVLVDGFGDDGILALRKVNQRIRDKSLDAACVRMAKLLGLCWNPSSRLFSTG